MDIRSWRGLAAGALCAALANPVIAEPGRELLFGDTHLHTGANDCFLSIIFKILRFKSGSAKKIYRESK